MALDCALGLGYLPILWSFFTLLAFAVSYSMSVAEGHVNPILPSISDTGARLPESNVFSLLMNISIMLAISNYITRYFQCQYQARHCGNNRENIFRYNHISLLLALTSVLGALVVANVQSRKENYLSEVHDTGAIVFFVFICIYFWVQTYISYRVAMYGLYSAWLCHLRLFISILLTLSSCLYLVTSVVSFHFFDSANNHTVAHWSHADGAYTLHVVSNGSEWLSVLLVLIFAVSYFDEFQQVMLIIDCQEKSPTIISYDGISYDGIPYEREYSVKMSSMDSLNDDNNN